MLTLLGLVLIGAVGNALWELAKTIRVRRQERLGEFAGWWWQITYPPEDTEMTGDTWSVELVSVRHSKRTLLAEMFRVVNPPAPKGQQGDYKKRWDADGRLDDDSVIDGRYWRKVAKVTKVVKPGSTNDAGHGTFHLWYITTQERRGEFSESVGSYTGGEFKHKWDRTPLRWIRVGAPAQELVLSLLRAHRPPSEPDAYPRAVHAQLAAVIKGHPVPPRWWQIGGASASALVVGPLPALAMESERQRITGEPASSHDDASTTE